MNKKVFNKLLVCALILNVATPMFNAAELTSEVMSESGSEVATDSEVGSEVTTDSEVGSEVTTDSEVGSEVTTDSEVGSEIETASDSGDNEFYISTDYYIGDENTQVNDVVDGSFSVSTFSSSALINGATITIDAPAGIEISNITITNDETGLLLNEGTNYTLEDNVITLTSDLEMGTDLTVNYSAKMLNASSDILGSTSGVYVDQNGNEEFDGKDYYIQSPGFDIEVENDGVSQTENVSFKSEIIGGEIAVENTGVSRKYKDGKISGSASYSIENTGDFAIEIRSIYEDFDLVADSDEYYVYGTYSSRDEMTFSVHGSDFMSFDDLIASFTSSADEYLNPGETMDVKVQFNIDEEMTDANLSEYNFGSWLNFTKHVKAEFVVDTTYANNIFGQEVTNPEEIAVTTSLYQKSSETTEDKTDDETGNETVVTDDKTDDSYTQMEVESESEVDTLATTGSAVASTLIVLMVTLIIAFVAKLKLARK